MAIIKQLMNGETVLLPDDVSREYADGYASCLNSVTENPFIQFSPAWYEWKDGFNDAREEFFN